MKISYKWLQDYVPNTLEVEQLSEILTATGLEVEGVEKYESIPGGLKGVVTGVVLTCEKHPDADKLSLTTVDVGSGTILSIVCGAPNVAAGQKVLVATIGTELPDGKGGTFTIKSSKIRGALSEGMICAEDELGLGDSHDGIMVLQGDTPVGLTAVGYLGAYEDHVIEIGLTPNRSDANGHIGVARDIAAVLQIHHGQNISLKYPDTSKFVGGSEAPPIEVEIRDTDKCTRYAGIYIKNVKVGESPNWLKHRLNAIGQRPLNNIVDITNYILHEYGQPLHAFDGDKIQGQRIIVSTLAQDTIFLALDEVERKLHQEDLIICDGDLQPMCIGGVFGGLHSGVSDQTVNIFLESAHFAPTSIRRTSTRHQLRTDAARCFEKGTDPNGCIAALQRATLLIQELAGGEPVGPIVDVYPQPIGLAKVSLSTSYFNQFTGLQLSTDHILDIVKSLEMNARKEGEIIHVEVPSNKPDVTRPADLIEEVLRIYGLDNVPVSDKFTYSVGTRQVPDKNELKDKISEYLCARGFNEMMAMSITQSSYFKEAMPVEEDKLVYINNTSNIQLDVMRPNLLISALEAVAFNFNRKQLRLRLFEFGSSYIHNDGAYDEIQAFSMVLAGDQETHNWRKQTTRKYDFYDIKAEVHNLLDRLGVGSYQVSEISDGKFSYGMQYNRGEAELVSFGKVQSKICKTMGIKLPVFAAIFNWDNLFKAIRKNKVIVAEISKYPEVSRDLALVLDKSIQYSEVETLARKTEKKILRKTSLFDVYENEEQLGIGKKSYAINFTLGADDRTLSDKDIDQVMEKLTKVYEEQLGAFIRK
jgi:phenylalanyl-tRNA synthetase beta chain